MKKNIVVAAGIVINDGKVLIAQRKEGKNHALFWEFPGGKLEEGESFQECLKREFMEEFDLPIVVGTNFKKIDFEYEYASMIMEIYFAKSDTKEVKKLAAHEKAVWVEPERLKEYKFIPADELIVDELLERLQSSSQYHV